MSTINIAIGRHPFNEETLTSWEICETDAPDAYDGFGTFTVHEYNGVRTVLIRCEHWQWQATRYSSGNKYCKPSPLDADDIKRYLWDRILGRGKHDE